MQKHAANRYDGCIEPWKLNIALARIRAFGVPEGQQPDILQKLVLAINGFKSRYQCANRERAAILRIVNNGLASLVRSQQRERKRMERHRERLGLTAENAEHHPLFVAEDHTAMRLDIENAVAALPPNQRAVCQRLMNGHSITEIANAMGIGWHAVQRLIGRIRQQFAGKELDAWLQK